jgi:hypothetical protein
MHAPAAAASSGQPANDGTCSRSGSSGCRRFATLHVHQCLYLVIMAGGVGVHQYYRGSAVAVAVVEFMPGRALHLSLPPFGAAVGLLLFVLTTNSNPGVVTLANAAALRRAHDPEAVRHATALGFTIKECTTCGLRRPPRTRHCRLCDVCVHGYDHHCAWLNVCIGHRNLRLFHAFLGVHAALAGYGCAFVWWFLSAVAKCKRQARPAGVNVRAWEESGFSTLSALLLGAEWGRPSQGAEWQLDAKYYI